MTCSSMFYANVHLQRTISLCVCETWSLKRISLTEDFREEEQSDKAGENCTVKSSMIFVFQKMLLE
jgi:hypothetical protein